MVNLGILNTYLNIMSPEIWIQGTPGKEGEVLDKLIELGGNLEYPLDDISIFGDPEYVFYINREGYIKGTMIPELKEIVKRWTQIHMTE